MSNEAGDPKQNPFEARWPARVASLLGESWSCTQVVINRSLNDGVKKGSRFLVYALSEQDLVDPESGESLGRLEIVRGTGVAVHVQDKIATIESEPRRKRGTRIVRTRSPYSILGEERVIEETPTKRLSNSTTRTSAISSSPSRYPS